ncbi:S8 family serine peptidase [Deinococcus hopiensis]|nr:S8 family serine peptidase [Deinococcus hopiensis]
MLLTLTLATACSNVPPASQAQGTPERFGHVAIVPLQSSDTPEDLAQIVGGTVLEWNDCAAGEHCSALVGLNHDLKAQSVGALKGRDIYVEPNRDVFGGGGAMTATMGGKISMWSGGKISMWSGGKISMWSGGVFAPLPENTALWKKINLEQGQLLAPRLGAGVTVAVIDSGIDLAHPAFEGALSDPGTWRDFYSNDGVPQEEGTFGVGAYGHGTNVAGIVLQVAPQAKIMPLRALGPDGSGDVVMIAQAIDWAVARGAQIINLSLGSTEVSKVVQEALQRASDQGVLVVSSAGNEDRNKITYPAAVAETREVGNSSLSVGSVDLNDLKSSFSNYASNLEMVAPGEQVYAPAPEGRMAAWSGTSMAAPMASGALALALSAGAGPAGLTNLVKQTAANVYSNGANAAYAGKLGEQGRLDLKAFLSSAVH